MVVRANYLFAFSKNLKIELNKKTKKPTLIKQLIRSRVKPNELLTLTGPGFFHYFVIFIYLNNRAAVYRELVHVVREELSGAGGCQVREADVRIFCF